MQHPPTPPPAGWFDDPNDATRLRWWNGSDWTDDYHPKAPGMQIAGAPAAGGMVANSAFKSTAGLATALYLLLAVVTVTELAEVWSGSAEAAAALGGIWALTFIATAIVFIVWFHRAYSNLPALGAPSMRYGTGWAIGAWFIPIFNYVRPGQIAHDISRGSDPDEPDQLPGDWNDSDAGQLVSAWWAAWVIYNVTYNFMQDTQGALQLSAVIGIAAAGTCAAWVHQVTSAQAARHAKLQQAAEQQATGSPQQPPHSQAA